MSCVWSQIVAAGAPPHAGAVFPDGCIDIVWASGQAPRVAGPDTGPVPFMLAPGTDMVGVRFRPGRAKGLLAIPADQLRDLRLPLDEIWPRLDVRTLVDSAGDRPPGQRLRLLLAELGRRGSEAPPPDAAVDAMLGRLAEQEGGRPLREPLAVGDRQLRRRFRAQVGYGPSTLARVLRFQRLLALARHHPGARLVWLAMEAGYTDQPHMTHEVRRLAGGSPAPLLGGGEMSDSYKTRVLPVS